MPTDQVDYEKDYQLAQIIERQEKEQLRYKQTMGNFFG
jgi:hypothetical protein